MRKALIVGIDYYQHGNPLYGCVTDAKNVESLLKYNIKRESQEERQQEKEKNFECVLKTASSSKEILSRNDLKDAIENLFSDPIPQDALFYFSGHGKIEYSGGYILAGDSKRGDEGIAMADILNYANESPARNKIIILDCCYSGSFGSSGGNKPLAALSEGLTILTSSTKDQYSVQDEGRGVFTSLFIDGLEGAAADIVGNITPGSLYAHIDQSLGVWEQRPVFKTNVMNFISLRSVPPKMLLEELRMIIDFFPSPEYIFPLDPSYEPEMKGRDEGMPLPVKSNTNKFAILQKYNRLNLLVPVDAPHMWHAAMKSQSCKLTALGKHYWRLAKKERF